MSTLRVDDPVLLDFADEVGDTGPVSIRGAGTRWEVGGALDSSARVLSAPEGVVEYHAAEMTVRVRAGTSVTELHAQLEQQRQRTALPDRGGTIGGAVVIGENDLAVLGRGSVRSAVLQVRYVSAEAEVVTGGGPVVKNVSGFNVPKLIVGSLGTLGLVVEVVLRTNPIPETSLWLMSSEADPIAARNAVLRPSVVLWDGTNTWVQLEGYRSDVHAESAVLADLASFAQTDGPPALPPNRWRLASAEIARLDAHDTGKFVASVGVGTLWAQRPQPERNVDAGSASVAQRMKQFFDPTARLNPGRRVGRP
ncbi:MAG: FAD-binding protein [Acidimicrobiales bacterium]